MEEHFIGEMTSIFSNLTTENQSDILQHINISPMPNTEICWKIGGGYDEKQQELRLGFSIIIYEAIVNKTSNSFEKNLRNLLAQTKKTDIVEIDQYLRLFCENVALKNRQLRILFPMTFIKNNTAILNLDLCGFSQTYKISS